MSQYIRDRWGAEQGFPPGPVYAITQTGDGYLWIGTQSGLVRFDGLRFSLINPKSDAPPLNNVLGLAVDYADFLWARLPGPVVVRYKNGRFESAMAAAGMPYSNVTALAKANDGSLLFSRLEDGAVRYSRGHFEVLPSATPAARSPVISLAQTRDGTIWLGTRDAGLFQVKEGGVTAFHRDVPDTKINALLSDGDRLWIGTDNGLGLWTGSEITSGGLPKSLNNFQALALAKDRDSSIWAGTNSHGLLRISSGQLSSLRAGDSASQEAVTAVFEDREGNIWTGSAGGIQRLRDSAFVTYSSSEHLDTDGNIPLFVDSTLRLWFPPAAGGLSWFKDGAHGSIAVAGLNRDIIYTIAGTPGELWLGRKMGGLTHLRLTGGAPIAQTWTQKDGLAQNSVYSVYPARDGAVWAGTLSAGASRLQHGRFQTFTKKQGLASNTVASIVEDSAGTIWFATPEGVSAFSHAGWKSWSAGDGLPSSNVNCLLQDANGTLWAGTAAGLAFFRSGRFISPAGTPSSLKDAILGMADDEQGWLWVTTSSRVLKVRRDSLQRDALQDGDVREYSVADGLRSTDGVKRHRSVVKDGQGRIWMSLNRGISVVEPARLASSSSTAKVLIQTVAADGKPAEADRQVRIPAGAQRVTFSYAGLTLSVPERVRYRYQLQGFDQGWSNPTASREAVYTNLSPRTYRFRVIASNADGAWNGDEASIGVEVEPAFWQAWWFRAAVVIACGFSILVIYRFRLRQLTRQLNLRFEERLAERTRIAQDLQDTLLQGFRSASSQLRNADDLLPSDSSARPLLTRVLQLTDQVMQEGRDAVSGLSSADITTQSLEDAFEEVYQECSTDQTADFRLSIQGRPRELNPVLRADILRIGREALINACRHSGADQIQVEVNYSTRQLEIRVRDNGHGIRPEVLKSGREGHWGLPGMRERAERIGAGLQVSSRPGAGTEIVLSVPAQLAFAPKAEGSQLQRLARLFRSPNQRSRE